MVEAIAEIQAYTAGMDLSQFNADAKTLKAVAWNLAMIGEAARHLPREVEEAYPVVPWAKIRGLRNRIVHGYDLIDLEIVWNTVRHELGPLVPVLERILREAPD